MQKSITVITPSGEIVAYQIETDNIKSITGKGQSIVVITMKDETTIELKSLTNTLQQINGFIFNRNRTIIDFTQDLNRKYFSWHYK